MNAIAIKETPELQLIEESKAKQIKATFEPMVSMLEGFEDAYNSILKESKEGITEEVTKKAKRLRLDIGKVRIETGKLKDKQKEYIKLEDKAIMGVHNILVYAVKEKEDNLKDIENYFEKQEQLRLEKLQIERVGQISEYLEDAHERDFSNMDNDVWDAYFNQKKQDYLDRIEAEKKAEEERIAKEKAEAEERERIRKENEKLKAEAEERERLEKIEEQKRQKAEAERIAKEKAERLEREEKERAEREKYEAKLKAERLERQRIEDELKAKQEAEKKEAERIEAEKQKELSKDDNDKIITLSRDIKNIKHNYNFKSKKNQQLFSKVKELLEQAENLIIGATQ